MNKPRVIFFGTPEFACAILKTLNEENYPVIAAVSQPDKPVGRKRRIIPTPVHALADELGIPVIQPEKLKEAAEEIGNLQPELIVTCAYGQIIPQKILSMPAYGCLNIHPSLLPKYRGGAPIHHAVMAGDDMTGVCLMEMVKKMDAGKIYDRRMVPVGEDETTAELTVKLIEAGCDLIRNSLPRYLAGELPGEEQDEAEAVIIRNISPEEEQIRFHEEKLNGLYNHARALIDWPLPYGIIEGKRMRFLKVRKEECGVSDEPGTILGFRDQAMEIACDGGILKVYELQPEGKKPMAADAYKNGAGRTMIGRVFE